MLKKAKNTIKLTYKVDKFSKLEVNPICKSKKSKEPNRLNIRLIPKIVRLPVKEDKIKYLIILSKDIRLTSRKLPNPYRIRLIPSIEIKSIIKS